MKIHPDSAVYHYSPAGMLRVIGADAATFLQGQFTNDLSNVAKGQSVYGLWLDRRGKVIGDSHVIRCSSEPEFRIVSLGTLGAAIAAHLQDHIIADEVEVIEETGEWLGISILGAGNGPWLSSGERPGYVFPGRRDNAENWEWVFSRADEAAARAEVEGARVATAEDMERTRILAAIPAVPDDIGPADLPNEGGLDSCAISYSKGCYIGQEVMARIKALGRVRRKLVLVSGSGKPPARLSGLWQGGRKEGELRSAAPSRGGFVGLALVSIASAAAGGPFSLEPEAAPSVQIAMQP